ncbi:LysR substrate-binding domain-containing protein [Roseovarius salis]|uniref:LysR family transcriptional regulator n=1 Tax=Roseovarius salis TaxID=3376063 RepID=UPI0037C908E0
MKDDLRLSLKALRAFAAVVERGSIAAAAEALNTSASAVAASVDQVEAEFGASLLIRTRARGIAPTPQGAAMAGRFRTLLDDYATVLSEGRDIAQTLTGTLRVGYYAPVAPAFLPRLVMPLMRDNPDLRLELREHDNDSAQEALLSGALDVILFAGQDLRAGVETRVLLDLPPYVLLPAGHPLEGEGPVPLERIARHPLVQLDRPLARPYLDRLFLDSGLQPQVAARADSTEMVRSLVGAGMGIAVLNMRPFTTRSYAGDALSSRPLDPGLPRLQLLSGRAKGRPRRSVSAFLDALHGWMAGGAASDLTV